MSKVVQSINDRCPLQNECERKRCDYKFREKECSYYIGNTRPGAEIEDQTKASDEEYAEWEKEILDSPLEEDADEELPPGLITTPGPSGLMMPLPVDKLIPHPDNPRKELGDLTELADSIKANGIFQNLTVVPADADCETFIVVIGHRRLAAAKLAGLKEVPCVIANMDAKEQVRTMLLENMQRSDLTVYEQAQGFQMMLDMGDSVEEIAAKSGFSKTTVRRRVKMMELDQGTLKTVSERQLSLTDFDELSKIEDAKARNDCLSEIGTSNFKQTACKEAIETAIGKYYGDNRLNAVPAVREVVKEFGYDRTFFVLASAIQRMDTDGRISRKNKEWARTIPIPAEDRGQAYYMVTRSHPGLLDIFTNTARHEYLLSLPLKRADIKAEASRILEQFREAAEPNSPNRTHFMARVSPDFWARAKQKDHDRLMGMLPFASLSLSTLNGYKGIYALITRDEDRSRPLILRKPSVRKKLQEPSDADVPKPPARNRPASHER